MTNSLHELQQLNEQVYWLPPDERTDRPVLGVICGERAALLVDAGNSLTHAGILKAQITEHNLPQPQFVALTHWHWDHVFGGGAFDVPIIAHARTRRQIARMAQLDWSDAALDARVEAGEEITFCRDMIKVEFPQPDRSITLKVPEIAFETQVTVDLGGITAEIIHVGGEHSDDCTVIFVPEMQAVFLGDCLGTAIYDREQYTTQQFFPLLDRLVDMNAEWYFHGHDAQPERKAAFRAYVDRVKTIGRLVDQGTPQRDKLIETLRSQYGDTLSDWDIEDLDAFLRGRPTA